MDRVDVRKLFPALAWAALIAILSHGFVDSRAFVHGISQAAPKLTNEKGFSHFWSQWWWLFVKGWHVLEFLVLTLLLHRALPSKSLAIIACLAIAAASLDEWHQTFIPRRGGLVTDVFIDTIGIAVAAAWVAWTSKRNRNSGAAASI